MNIERDIYLLYRLSSNAFISTRAFGINIDFSSYVDNNKIISSCVSPNSSGMHNQESNKFIGLLHVALRLTFFNGSFSSQVEELNEDSSNK